MSELPSDHDDDLLQAHADSELDPATAADVERRLATDAGLRARYESILSLRRLLRAVPLIAALALAGCAGSPDPVAAPPAVAVPAPTASAGRPIADDPPGTATCGRLVTAIRDATLMDPGVVYVTEWHPDTTTNPTQPAQRLAQLVGVARKP